VILLPLVVAPGDAVRRVDHLVDAAMSAIAAPIHARLRRHKHLRPEQAWASCAPG
jgi:hypothetical protein